MCLDIQTRKWMVHRNTSGEHICPGCLVTQDKVCLYIFSNNGGVERRILNDDNAPWERIQTDIRFCNGLKFYPVPNVKNQFYCFGNNTTSRITINEDNVQLIPVSAAPHKSSYEFN